MLSLLRGLLGRRVLLVLLTTGVVAAMLTSPVAQARPSAPTDAKAQPSGRQVQAGRALDRVQKIFAGQAPRRDATLALRDLNLLRSSLPTAERARAATYFARPSVPNAQVRCWSTFCIHWSPTMVTTDDVSPANGLSDYIDLVAKTLSDVQGRYTSAGYRTVKKDGTRGGNGKPDIYIQNLGSQGLYGYCNTDDLIPRTGPYDTSAYCALDNDYSPAEFPTNTPSENLQVTVAHEYFHATQFAYDYLEDSWFLEATATWAEDELYDDVDDNLQYLPSGPLGAPKLSLDLFGGSHHYGDWIFFRYLTERFPALRGGLPSLILDMFIKADASKGGADQYSAQAISAVLKERGTSFAKMFTKFADANLDPGANYEEGAANDYPVAPYRTFGHSQGWYTTKLDHMSSASMYFEPSDATTQELKLTVDLASKSTSPAAIVSVHLVGGGVQTSQIPLNQNGNGSKVFPFAQSTVSWVDFTLVNASARFDPCWDNSPYSCSGKPVDENLVAKIKGAVR